MLDSRRTLFRLLSLTTSAFALSTFSVSAQFSQIQEAIRTASPGDTIEVMPGLYQPFVVDKGVNVIGRGFVAVPEWEVVGVPAGQTARVSNIDAGVFHHLSGNGIAVRNCEGPVHISSILTSVVDGKIDVVDSAFVTLSNCSISGDRHPTADFTRSTVQVSSCEIQSSSGSALHCNASDVRVSESTIDTAVVAIPMRNTIVVTSGTLVLGRGSHVRMRVVLGTPQPAILNHGSLGLDPGATLTTSAVQSIVGTGTVVTLPAPSAVITEAQIGGSFAGRVTTTAGAASGILLGAPMPPVATPFGPLGITGSIVTIDAGTVPASGQRTFAFPVPASVPPGLTLSIQAFVNDGTSLHLSMASTAVFSR